MLLVAFICNISMVRRGNHSLAIIIRFTSILPFQHFQLLFNFNIEISRHYTDANNAVNFFFSSSFEPAPSVISALNSYQAHYLQCLCFQPDRAPLQTQIHAVLFPGLQPKIFLSFVFMQLPCKYPFSWHFFEQLLKRCNPKESPLHLPSSPQQVRIQSKHTLCDRL